MRRCVSVLALVVAVGLTASVGCGGDSKKVEVPEKLAPTPKEKAVER